MSDVLSKVKVTNSGYLRICEECTDCKQTLSELPTEGVEIGTRYFVYETEIYYTWDGTEWKPTGGEFDLGVSGSGGGSTPTIGNNGNWFIDGKDTGKPSRGEKGDTGATGATGQKGDKGDKGDQGAKGDKGDPGEQGIQGIQGEKGDKGDPGEKGETGAQGEQGLPGEKGATGSAGARGSRWNSGTKITGTSTTATIFSGSGITDALVNDCYLNTSTYNVYQCTTAGNASVAKWKYIGCLKGAKGSDATVTVDSALSETSTNPVQNKVINEYMSALNTLLIGSEDLFDYSQIDFFYPDASTNQMVSYPIDTHALNNVGSCLMSLTEYALSLKDQLTWKGRQISFSAINQAISIPEFGTANEVLIVVIAGTSVYQYEFTILPPKFGSGSLLSGYSINTYYGACELAYNVPNKNIMIKNLMVGKTSYTSGTVFIFYR